MITQPITALTLYLKAANIPVDGVSSKEVVSYNPSATPAQISAGNVIVATFDGRARNPRPLSDIYTALAALTATQQTNIWNWLVTVLPTYTGPSAAALWALFSLAVDAGLATAALNNVKRRAAALYAYDNPLAFYKPSFDSGITIEGWTS